MFSDAEQPAKEVVGLAGFQGGEIGSLKNFWLKTGRGISLSLERVWPGLQAGPGLHIFNSSTQLVRLLSSSPLENTLEGILRQQIKFDSNLIFWGWNGVGWGSFGSEGPEIPPKADLGGPCTWYIMQHHQGFSPFEVQICGPSQVSFRGILGQMTYSTPPHQYTQYIPAQPSPAKIWGLK